MRHEAGFTLVELLAALAILAVLTGVLAAALSTGFTGRERITARADALEELRAAQSLIRRTLSEARPVQWTAQGRFTVAAFDGAPGRVSFIGTLPGFDGPGGLHQIRFGVEDGALVMERALTAGEEQVFRTADPVVLLRDVAALRVTYFGKRARATQGQWHPEWKDEASLPDLVRLEVESSVAGKPLWPALVVAPQLGPQPR